MQQQRVTGRFPVGLRDFEYDVAKVESSGPMEISPEQVCVCDGVLSEHGCVAFLVSVSGTDRVEGCVQHLVGSIYYPCEKQRRARQATWIPHFVYAQGTVL